MGVRVKSMAAGLSVLVLVAVLTACVGAGEPEIEVTPPPASVETPTPESTPTVEAERGTRANPLAVGETRRLSPTSIWTLGATGPTESRDGYVLLPLRIAIDWEAAKAQAEEDSQQWSPENDGLEPYGSLRIEYVTAAGRSYDTLGDYSGAVPDNFWDLGTVYAPAESVDVTHAVSVPAEDVEGGVWAVRNSAGDAVFIASE